MEILSNTVALSRLQFAFTAIFHMIWPVLTTGMSIYLIVVEGLWLKTKNPVSTPNVLSSSCTIVVRA